MSSTSKLPTSKSDLDDLDTRRDLELGYPLHEAVRERVLEAVEYRTRNVSVARVVDDRRTLGERGKDLLVWTGGGDEIEAEHRASLSQAEQVGTEIVPPDVAARSSRCSSSAFSWA